MVTADYAAVEPQTGKLNIVGAFNTVFAPEFPTTHPRMYLALKFEGGWSNKVKRHNLLITLAGEDGEDIVGIKGEFELPPGLPGIPPQCGIVCEFNHLTFPNPGDYRFYVRVDDGAFETSVLVRVVKKVA